MIEHIPGTEDGMGVVGRIPEFPLEIFCPIPQDCKYYPEISHSGLCCIKQQKDFADVIKFTNQLTSGHLKAEFSPATSSRRSQRDSKCEKNSMHSCWLEDRDSHVSRNEEGL